MTTRPIIPTTSPVAVDALDPRARALLDAAHLDELDNLVMARIEEQPGDLQFFVPVLRALVRRKAEDRAGMLLQLVLENLAGDGCRDVTTSLMAALLRFWPENRPAREYLMHRLTDTYGTSPRLPQFLKTADVMASEDPLKTLQELERWLRYDAGRPVYVTRRGAGIITDVNVSLGLVRVTLENAAREVMSLRITEAERVLTPLDPGDFYYDVLTDRGAVQRDAAANPAEILRRLFLAFPGPLPLADIKEHLIGAGIIAENSWSAWWKRAREDRRLTVGPGARPVCTWSDSAEDARDALIAQFAAAPLRDRLKLAKTHAHRSPELSRVMVHNLADAAAAEQDPALALELVLTLEKTLGVDDHDLAPVLERVLRGPDAARLVAGIADRTLRRLALGLLKEHRSDWESAYLELLHLLDDSTLISLVYDALRSSPAGNRLADAVTAVIRSPESAPALYAWIGAEMPGRAELAEHANRDYIAGLVASLAHDRLKSVHADLRRLFDGGSAVDLAVRKLDSEAARQVLVLLERESRLEEYRKEPLCRFIKQRFPDSEPVKRETFFVTARSLAEKRTEYERLVSVDLPQNALEIKRTREYGDLRENFEYHAARARQELLSSRAKSLHDELTLARALDPASVDVSAVNVGTRIRLVPGSAPGDPLDITILGPWDSDPSKNVYSYLAPAVKKLLGARPGDRVDFNDAVYAIGTIEVWAS